MPARDRTGPMGAGPRTRRGMGYCGSYDQARPYYPARNLRCGVGYGQAGMGRGWRRMYYATGLPGWLRPGIPSVTPEQELAWLRDQAEWLKNQLEALNRRMEELEPRQQ